MQGWKQPDMVRIQWQCKCHKTDIQVERGEARMMTWTLLGECGGARWMRRMRRWGKWARWCPGADSKGVLHAKSPWNIHMYSTWPKHPKGWCLVHTQDECDKPMHLIHHHTTSSAPYHCQDQSNDWWWMYMRDWRGGLQEKKVRASATAMQGNVQHASSNTMAYKVCM
jgi:hypothetical protein